MKKYIFIAFLSFITLLGVSQTKTDTVVSNIKQTVLESLPDSSAITFTKVYSDIKSGITALSSSLKVGSEHVYEVLVRQQLVESITSLIILILSLIGFILSHKIFKKGFKDDWDEDGLWLTFIFICIPTAVFFVYNVFTINSMITGFVNPEYGAIKEILEVIK